jgi:Flp pilus assembly CpaE family ATPase
LIDADTYGGSIAGYLELFDESPGFLAAGRLAAQENLDAAEIARLTHSFQVGSASIAVLSGIVSARRWPELSAMRVRSCIQVLRTHFDVIICDVGFNLEQDEEISSDMTSPRRNQATLEILAASDVVVAVASADVIGIARFIQSLESLRSCVGQARLVVVANRVRDSRAASASVVKHTLHRVAGLTEITVVNDDRQTFAAAVDLAVPLCVSAPKSVVRGQIVRMTQGLMR